MSFPSLITVLDPHFYEKTGTFYQRILSKSESVTLSASKVRSRSARTQKERWRIPCRIPQWWAINSKAKWQTCCLWSLLEGQSAFILFQMSILCIRWVSYAFSGFLAARVPFPLTLRFKQLMQRGIDLSSLDASWISSMSWYFIGAFGMRGTLTVFENIKSKFHMKAFTS